MNISDPPKRFCKDCKHFDDSSDGQLEHLGYIKYPPHTCENPDYFKENLVHGMRSQEAILVRNNYNLCGSPGFGFVQKSKLGGWWK